MIGTRQKTEVDAKVSAKTRLRREHTPWPKARRLLTIVSFSPLQRGVAQAL